MFRTAFLILIVLAVAIGGGAASVWYALRSQEGIGAVEVGGWTAFPNIGTGDADPYSRARTSRDAILTLGRAEGLSFVAQRDSGGDPLLRQCTYTIEGFVPPARFWTLYAQDEAKTAIPSGRARQSALQSGQLLRMPDNSVSITADANAQPGNWLALSGSGAMSLVLTLYDTTIAGSTGLSGLDMPQILKAGCHA